mmetsp:Transcript_16731/g.47726  ORF Transcript_16731/g.47726 Transcript_16731/m.47726 type:complete len:268 (-) Transcript_16731:292-1095(-)
MARPILPQLSRTCRKMCTAWTQRPWSASAPLRTRCIRRGSVASTGLKTDQCSKWGAAAAAPSASSLRIMRWKRSIPTLPVGREQEALPWRSRSMTESRPRESTSMAYRSISPRISSARRRKVARPGLGAQKWLLVTRHTSRPDLRTSFTHARKGLRRFSAVGLARDSANVARGASTVASPMTPPPSTRCGSATATAPTVRLSKRCRSVPTANTSGRTFLARPKSRRLRVLTLSASTHQPPKRARTSYRNKSLNGAHPLQRPSLPMPW